ncbi:Ig-like domain-containing protein [Natronomonas sp.]|uniref:Ig-like domain-containing protein n=1 Tax=Natronomonas sp. TaxID=2184060 RepID=UPI002FC39258
MSRHNDSKQFDRDDRGVSEILGGILVFALVVMVLILLQTWAVPATNQQTEFEHNQRTLGDFQQFGSEVDRAAALGVPGSTAIEAGTRYPPRFLLLNPPAPAGTVDTTQRTVRLVNVQATDPETGSKYLVGDTEYTFSTRSVAYDPAYNEYRNAPTTRYEGWALYNDFGDATRVYDRKGLLSDRTIQLTMLDGNVSESTQSSILLSTTPISAPSQTVSVRGVDANTPLTVRLDTDLSAEEWTSMLASEPNFGGATQLDHDSVEIQFRYADADAQPITYNLRMAKVGIGQGTTTEDAHYLTVTERPKIDGSGGTVTVDVRDRFNNPVPGVDVTFSSAQGSIPDPVVTSDAAGRATTEFLSPVTDTVTITATAAVNEGDLQFERGRVVLSGVVVEGSVPDRGSEFNPNDGTSFSQQSADFRSVGSGSNAEWFADVVFRNDDADTAKQITAIRVNAYVSSTFNRGEQFTPPDMVNITSGGQNLTLAEVQGPYVPYTASNAEVSPEATRTITFEFRDGSDNLRADSGDFFVVSIRFADGTVERYFVQPRFP